MSSVYDEPELVRERRLMCRQGTELLEREYARKTGGKLLKWALVRPDGTETPCTRAEGEQVINAIGQLTIGGLLMGERE